MLERANSKPWIGVWVVAELASSLALPRREAGPAQHSTRSSTCPQTVAQTTDIQVAFAGTKQTLAALGPRDPDMVAGSMGLDSTMASGDSPGLPYQAIPYCHRVSSSTFLYGAQTIPLYFLSHLSTTHSLIVMSLARPVSFGCLEPCVCAALGTDFILIKNIIASFSLFPLVPLTCLPASPLSYPLIPSQILGFLFFDYCCYIYTYTCTRIYVCKYANITS